MKCASFIFLGTTFILELIALDMAGRLYANLSGYDEESYGLNNQSSLISSPTYGAHPNFISTPVSKNAQHTERLDLSEIQDSQKSEGTRKSYMCQSNDQACVDTTR